MSYSPKQWRAIRLWLDKNSLRPELSAYPLVRGTSKDTGEVVQLHISNIVDFYAAERERQKRESREATKAERANKSRN